MRCIKDFPRPGKLARPKHLNTQVQRDTPGLWFRLDPYAHAIDPIQI